MDIATRFQPRVRPAETFLESQRNAMSGDSEGDSESHPRRKFQRTTTDSEATFRKPSLPASAMRPVGLEHRPSFSQRRKSTLRENVRVPSGPREFPSPGKRLGSTSSIMAPPMHESTNNSRAFLPQANSEPFLANGRLPATGYPERSRLSFFGNNQHSSTDETESPTTPAERASDGFDFVPTMNFDDFQNSIVDPNWTSPILSEFPNVSGGRALPKDPQQGNNMARGNGFAAGRAAHLKQEKAEEDRSAIGRTESFRRRISAVPGRGASGQTVMAQMPASISQPNLSVRTRRQSTMPQTAAPTSQPSAAVASRPPRKSVGPGLITSMMDRKGSSLQTPTTPVESVLKPALSRTSSLSKARRTTIQPSASAGAELPRLSTLTANTQSRANKVKSMQPPPRADPDTPGRRSISKDKQNRAHTPSSSGNKRQSTASGRASGLGARTISPTDARRLKRISMMQAPPMPTNLPKGPPTPQEEVPNPFVRPELPRLTQPSPSLIPRKASATPNSARASPEGRQGFTSFGSLSSKSSYQSLVSNSNSTSRLPTPKPRNVHSSSAQYNDEQYSELVPPVPAIPKAYESPKEQHDMPFFSNVKVSSNGSGLGGEADSGFDFHGSMLPPPVTTGGTPRGSMDVPRERETPRKRSAELPRQHHNKRASVFGNPLPAGSSGAATAGPKSSNSGRGQPEATGRKNNNLQPLRLPPMNLQPINTPTSNKIAAGMPRPSQELEGRDDYMSVRTPEPVRRGTGTKTPGTPMTASKATFFRRQDEGMGGKGLRSSSSHYALRDMMGLGGGGSGDGTGNMTRFWDDSDGEGAAVPGGGVRIPATTHAHADGHGNGKRAAITPFASGSLPKGSGEFARLRGRPSGEYHDEYDLGQYAESLQLQNARPQGPRAKTSAPTTSQPAARLAGTPAGSPMVEQPPQLLPEAMTTKKVEKEKEKETTSSSGGGLRRKLSLGWRRSSSKAAVASLGEKGSPQAQQQAQPAEAAFENVGKEKEREKERERRLQKRSSEMPPPPPSAKLPSSATWSGDVPGLPSSARPSLEGARRKSTLTGSMPVNGNGGGSGNNASGTAHGEAASPPVAKTRALHSEQPQPVVPTATSTTRASSWGTFRAATTAAGKATAAGVSATRQHKPTASSTTLSAIVKDKDDLAADEEMRRLSQKRRDVDTAARESDALKARAVARSPISPERILYDRNCALNIFERGEVMDYEKDGIYFTGTKHAKKIIGSLSSSSPTTNTTTNGTSAEKAGNYGYDDERGDYNIVFGDHLAYRYEVVDLLGKGSFGQVVRCVDHKEGGVVAVKIIRNKKRFHQQALVEVGILGRLREWDPDGAHATLSITSSFYFRSHLCIVTPCLSINLYEFIRAHNFAGFSLPLIRRFSRQLLACMVLLQTKKIIHCDLKPENILLCEARKADVRVIDFGSSCREEEKVYTYIQSRFYRSPEVILGSSYGMGIDMWSLGCILAELWTGYPLFPGENEQEQLACIMEIFGPPDRHLVERCTRKKLFFDSVGKPRVTVSSKGRRRRPSSKTLAQALKTEDEAFLDFIARCLRWDPERRLKPAEAVGHAFITNGPLHARQGIPEEARKGARVRSSAAAAAPATASSPVKRGTTAQASAKEGNAFAQLQQLGTSTTNTTPAKEKSSRTLPETPQTALRNGTAGAPFNSNSLAVNQGSPSKLSAASRRHSSIANVAGAAAVAGSKRASNGTVLGGGMVQHAGGPQMQRIGSGIVPTMAGNLAAMAARESMHGAGSSANAQSSARWRG